MLVANVVSTIPGALIGAFTASLSGVIFAVPLVFVLGRVVQRQLSLLPQPGPRRWISGGADALAFLAFFILSVVLFELAGSALRRAALFIIGFSSSFLLRWPPAPAF